MGRLLNEQDIIKKNIDSYMERSIGTYSRFLDDATASFTTYYRKNTLKSTSDLGLENVEKIMGSNSPVSFDKIENMPIFGIDPFSLNLEKDEFGAQSSVSGEGIMIPDTIKPLPDDLFSIDYIGNLYLFKITDVQPDKIKGKSFYKVQFSFTKILDKKSDIMEQVKETYVCVFTNVGTDHKAILPKDDYLNLQYLDKTFMALYDFFSQYYYNKKYNIFTMQTDYNYLIYNRLFYYFCTQNNVMKPTRSFLNDFYIDDSLPKDLNFYNRYKESIYYALEKCNIDYLEEMQIFLLPLEKKYTQFRYSYNKFYDVNFIPFTSPIINGNETKALSDFNEEFYLNIKNNSLFEDNKEFLLENIIINYLNSNLQLTETLLDELNNYDLFPTLKNYLFIPLIMHILNYLRNRILNKID